MLISFFTLIAYRIYTGSKFLISMAKAKDLLVKSHHLIIIGLSVVIYEQTDRIMLRQMINEAAVGYYSYVNSIGGLFLAVIIESFSPTIMRSNKIIKEVCVLCIMLKLPLKGRMNFRFHVQKTASKVCLLKCSPCGDYCHKFAV